VLARSLWALSMLGMVSVAWSDQLLRYRPYDLDRIISRTLAYGLLTLLLALVYPVVVLGSAGSCPEAPAWWWPPPPWP
jgi:hypothetical protein